jgi:hypothetical protein
MKVSALINPPPLVTPPPTLEKVILELTPEEAYHLMNFIGGSSIDDRFTMMKICSRNLGIPSIESGPHPISKVAADRLGNLYTALLGEFERAYKLGVR